MTRKEYAEQIAKIDPEQPDALEKLAALEEVDYIERGENRMKRGTVPRFTCVVNEIMKRGTVPPFHCVTICSECGIMKLTKTSGRISFHAVMG